MKRLPSEKIKEDKNIVAFITSEYEQDVNSFNEMKTLANSSKQSAKVLIVTSVLDNGINIKYVELRNLVIITDTKTEFKRYKILQSRQKVNFGNQQKGMYRFWYLIQYVVDSRGCYSLAGEPLIATEMLNLWAFHTREK